jgi:hypothetical protein
MDNGDGNEGIKCRIDILVATGHFVQVNVAEIGSGIWFIANLVEF